MPSRAGAIGAPSQDAKRSLESEDFDAKPFLMPAYLPVYCASCAHASLSSAGAGEHQLRCSFCEASARVIPGPIYEDGDWLAFAEIDRAVFEGDLDGARASVLAEELQQMLDRKDAPLAVVQQMIERLPSLASARPALVNRLPRGPRMLMTLLIARTRDLPASSREHLAQYEPA